MAISIDYSTYIITVPKADLTVIQTVPFEILEHDIDSFRRELKAIEDNTDGIAHPATHLHETQSDLSGVTYARKITIIPPYSVTYEPGLYRVNLVGANNNVSDVLNLNGVQVIPSNSAGLISVATGGLTPDQSERILEIWQRLGLDITEPVEFTDTGIVVGDITVTLSDDGTTTTSTRTS